MEGELVGEGEGNGPGVNYCSKITLSEIMGVFEHICGWGMCWQILLGIQANPPSNYNFITHAAQELT